MTFFAPSEPEPEWFEPTPVRRRWRGDESDTLGIFVLEAMVIALTEEVAVLVSGLTVYPSGFSFSVVTLSRLDPAPEHLQSRANPRPWGRRGGSVGDGFRFGIAFADGSKVTDIDSWGGGPRGERVGRVLSHKGGGGGGRRWSQGYWCEPLPPVGEMRFVCKWEAARIEETETSIDSNLLIEAAERASALWPDDIDMPPDDDSRPTAGGGWSSSRG